MVLTVDYGLDVRTPGSDSCTAPNYITCDVKEKVGVKVIVLKVLSHELDFESLFLKVSKGLWLNWRTCHL